jgi:hypothetical protein
MIGRRPQFGLRLLLLFTALLAVLSAWFGASRDLNRETIRADLYELEQTRASYLPFPSRNAPIKKLRKLRTIDAQIAEKQRLLGVHGESETKSK